MTMVRRSSSGESVIPAEAGIQVWVGVLDCGCCSFASMMKARMDTGLRRYDRKEFELTHICSESS